jgi:hypothetical protein
MNCADEVVVLHEFPSSDIERLWRDSLLRMGCPAHYDSPDFFLEPSWAGKRPFAILALHEGEVVGVLTGLNEGHCVISGLQSRPQLCMNTTADATTAGSSLARGLLAEASSAELLTVYSWFPLNAFESYGFKCRRCEGCVVLDLTKSPETLFRQLN